MSSSLLVDDQQRAGSTAHCDGLTSDSYPPTALQGPHQLLLAGKSHSSLRTQIEAPPPRAFPISLHSCRTYADPSAIFVLVFNASASLSCLLTRLGSSNGWAVSCSS